MNKKSSVILLGLSIVMLLKLDAQFAVKKGALNQNQYDVAVYYFPQWHVDTANQRTHGYPWTEWETLKIAKPKFPGHQQPKVPLWGYEDEADPKVMAKKIDAAADNPV